MKEYVVTFTDIRNGSSTSMSLISKFSCIDAKESGKGKSHFHSYIEDNIIVSDNEIDNYQGFIRVTVEPEIPFVIIGSEASLDSELSATSDRRIFFIDETTMMPRDMIQKVLKSRNLFICISRGYPFVSFYPVQGMYELERFSSDSQVMFDLRPVSGLPYAIDLDKQYDHIVVESPPHAGEGDMFASYLVNDDLVCACGRDNIVGTLEGLSGSILVFADLGGFGSSYHKLVNLCKKNPGIVFYDYICFEELLYMSPLVQANKRKAKVMSPFWYLTLERFYENLLEKSTAGTSVRYLHGKAVSSEYKNHANFDVLFNSKVGEYLMNYILKFGSV